MGVLCKLHQTEPPHLLMPLPYRRQTPHPHQKLPFLRLLHFPHLNPQLDSRVSFASLHLPNSPRPSLPPNPVHNSHPTLALLRPTARDPRRDCLPFPPTDRKPSPHHPRPLPPPPPSVQGLLHFPKTEDDWPKGHLPQWGREAGDL